MLKAPAHQVAGHNANEGQLGPLVDGSGRFYKPLQSNGRGSEELTFYKSFFSDPRIPDHIRSYIPAFYGTKELEASDGSGLVPHMILEDVVGNLTASSIIDIKIGARTWYPHASEEYIEKCFKKDRETVSQQLGFRISGLQVHDATGCWKPAKKIVQSFGVEDSKLALKKFVSSNVEPNCLFACSVYGGILKQLLQLKSWFENQTTYHFCSTSILMFYGKDSAGAKVKLVDFAHVVDGQSVIDHNFLGGLCSLIKIVSEIINPPGYSCVCNGNVSIN